MLFGSRPVRALLEGGPIMRDVAASWNVGDVCLRANSGARVSDERGRSS